MKLLNKLALIAAMAVSANAMALQSMDDEALSGTTGQDGLTVKIFSPGISIAKLFLHDNDGLSNQASVNSFVSNNGLNGRPLYNGAAQLAYDREIAKGSSTQDAQAAADQIITALTQGAVTTYAVNTPATVSQSVNLGGTHDANDPTATGAGAIIVNNVFVAKDLQAGSVTAPWVELKIDTDGGANADGSGAFLNVGVDLGATNIYVGDISVGKSKANLLTGAQRGAESVETSILKNLNLSLGATKMNIQLGNQPQGALILLDGTITGGLKIEGLTLIDSDGLTGQALAYGGAAAGVAGEIYLGKITIASENSTNLSTKAKVNIEPNLGLALTLSGEKTDLYVDQIRLGSTTAASIGDVEIRGMDLGGTTVFVSGH